MARLRSRLEDYFIRNAAGIVDGVSEERGGLLADTLGELEERSMSVAAAEAKAAELDRRLARFGPADADERTQIDHLLRELEAREAELLGLRPRLEELETELAAAREARERGEAELAEQAKRFTAQERWVDDLRQRIERADAARKRAEDTLRTAQDGERQRARTALELGQERKALAQRDAELARREARLARLEALEGREAELQQLADRLAEQERSIAARESSLREAEVREKREREELRRREAEAATATARFAPAEPEAVHRGEERLAGLRGRLEPREEEPARPSAEEPTWLFRPGAWRFDTLDPHDAA